MDSQKLQAALRGFAQARDWEKFHNPKNLAMALSVEAAELLELFQWLDPEQARTVCDNASGKARVSEELADVLLYLLRLADVLDVDLEQAAMAKLERNEQKYPAEQVRGSAKKYTEYE